MFLEQPRKGKGTGDWYSWVVQKVGTRWLIKVQEVEVPISGPEQSLALTPLIWFEEKICFFPSQDTPAQGQENVDSAYATECSDSKAQRP